MSNRSDPDQALRFVGPDLGLNCLQRLSTDDARRQRVNKFNKLVRVYFILGCLLLISASFMAFWIKLTTYGECTRGFDKVSISIFCACYIL